MQNLVPNLQGKKFMFLGGGSNVLFTNDFDGLVIYNQIFGKEAKSISNSEFEVSVKSGENWHEFVLWTLENEYYGLENLSLIPGTVGAAPMQNIGAYGVEIKNYCIGVDAVDLQTGALRRFSNEECEFGYRESVFKRALKDKYFIYQVHFRLYNDSPIQTTYGAIRDVLEDKQILNPSHKDVSDAVIEIRSSKLPNPLEIGNAGSFFKNPVVNWDKGKQLINEYPKIPNYLDSRGFKIPAGWLIEQCGFKGYREGNVGSHKDQALVIVNHGGALGKEIYDYSDSIIERVFSKFGIRLEREVNII